VPHFSVTDVADDPREVVLVVGIVLRGRVWKLLLFEVVEGVGVEVESGGKFVLICYFLVYESVHVEVDSLQMQN
jgi:hypothetical protein